ncbi:MAG: MBL fold metallo-hydrolase [Caldilineaceae bacterium]|nr:MBL fold metallo-hydrolase [Caldilineaceae bacterium]
MSKPVTIEWVNHASFVLAYGEVRLICDPWLFGSAFNNGWDLLCATRFTADDFRDITHIWFSHEHPDHFSPPVLRQIPEDVRTGITVIFQETKDRKVIDFCRSLGFGVQELPNHKWLTLALEFRVMCGKVPFFDSWLFVDAGGTKVLNINDCVVDGDGVASEIAKHTGAVDLLLTQFSYANWLGNPEDVDIRKEAAAEKLERVKIQIDTFAPKQTIPFASFVYFSHEENVYLNDEVNTVHRAAEFIASQSASEPVVLYPGDHWIVGEAHDNEAR